MHGDVVLDQAFIQRIPVPVAQGRAASATFAGIGIDAHADEPEFVDGVLELAEACLDRAAWRDRQPSHAGETPWLRSDGPRDRVIVRPEPRLDQARRLHRVALVVGAR
jgi:hypothetical protein